MNILLVRLRLIGDVVFTTPLIRALRRQYPAASITYVVEPLAEPVVQNNPHLTDIITVPHSRGWRRLRDDLRLGAALRRRRFDLAIDLHGGARSAWLTRASGAATRIGYDISGRQWMYTRVVHRPRGLWPRHSVENQWDLLTAIDAQMAAPDRARDRVEMPVTDAARRSLSEQLRHAGIPAEAPLVVVHVSAGNPFRRWPESAFSALTAGLVSADERRWVLLTAGPSDQAAAGRVIAGAHALAGEASRRIVNAERLSLSELRAVMDRASLFVGGDSGPMHIAATSDVPVVAIFGPTLPARSAPWRPLHFPTISLDAGPLPCRPCHQRHCIPGDFRCLTRVTPSDVLDAATQLLGVGA